MKGTKIYLVISIAIQIIFAVFLIVGAESITYEYNLSLGEDVNKYGITESYVTTLGGINLISNVIAVCIVLKDYVIKRKGTLIVISFMCFLTSASFGNVAPWLALINMVVVACVKRKQTQEQKVKFNMKKVEETLRVERRSLSKKQIILIIALLMVYLLQLVPESILPNSPMLMIILVATMYISLLVLAICAFWGEIKQGFKIIKLNFKLYVKYIVRIFGVMFALYYVAIITTFFVADQTTSVNQEILEMLPMLFVAPIAIVWAPIVEEALFRGAIRKVIKNDWLYIVVSGSIFGLMHTLGEDTIAVAIATAVPYAILGGAFAYVYAKTNNLTGCMIAHSVYNTLGVMFMLLG